MLKGLLLLLQNNYERSLYVLLSLASFLALTIAYYVEYVMGLEPCVLCIYQRILFFILIILSISALYFFQYSKLFSRLIIICLIFACFLASYHSMIERGIISPSSECSPNIIINNELSVSEIKKMLYNKGVASCTKPTLVVFLLSMTEWNLLFNLFLLCIVYIIRYSCRRVVIN